MTEIWSKVRGLVVALAAFGVALVGLGAAPAHASDASTDWKKGAIEVCKKVQGPGDDLEFKFVIKKKDDKKDDKIVKKFTLKKNECKTVRVDKGTYFVKEKDLPDECKLKMIHVKGEENHNIKGDDLKGVTVKVKKGKTVKITFFDKCKKEDRKD